MLVLDVDMAITKTLFLWSRKRRLTNQAFMGHQQRSSYRNVENTSNIHENGRLKVLDKNRSSWVPADRIPIGKVEIENTEKLASAYSQVQRNAYDETIPSSPQMPLETKPSVLAEFQYQSNFFCLFFASANPRWNVCKSRIENRTSPCLVMVNGSACLLIAWLDTQVLPIVFIVLSVWVVIECWRRGLVVSRHVSLWCRIFDRHRATYQSNIRGSNYEDEPLTIHLPYVDIVSHCEDG